VIIIIRGIDPCFGRTTIPMAAPKLLLAPRGTPGVPSSMCRIEGIHLSRFVVAYCSTVIDASFLADLVIDIEGMNGGRIMIPFQEPNPAV
jgi:hypothetical protein